LNIRENDVDAHVVMTRASFFFLGGVLNAGGISVKNIARLRKKFAQYYGKTMGDEKLIGRC
jgi:hypothetical protein